MSGYLPFPKPTRRRRSTSRTVTVEVGKRSAWLRGAGIAPLLDEIESPRMWCPRHKCLTCPVDRVDDLLALLEHRDGRMVELTAVDR
ncbi:hypothetical protein [Modestobacter sp. SYSU DS0875]